MFKLLERFRRRNECSHEPVQDFTHWENAPSGQGYWISKCELCGIEMTKAQSGGWRPIAMKDRP
jgi:hypothetical protein